MKKMFFALMTMLTVSISVNAMSYEELRAGPQRGPLPH